jgi:hypothetical protein
MRQRRRQYGRGKRPGPRSGVGRGTSSWLPQPLLLLPLLLLPLLLLPLLLLPLLLLPLLLLLRDPGALRQPLLPLGEPQRL